LERGAPARYTCRRLGKIADIEIAGRGIGPQARRTKGLIATMKTGDRDKVLRSQPMITLSKRRLFSHKTNRNAIPRDLQIFE
jgi:hypothetical protein